MLCTCKNPCATSLALNLALIRLRDYTWLWKPISIQSLFGLVAVCHTHRFDGSLDSAIFPQWLLAINGRGLGRWQLCRRFLARIFCLMFWSSTLLFCGCCLSQSLVPCVGLAAVLMLGLLLSADQSAVVVLWDSCTAFFSVLALQLGFFVLMILWISLRATSLIALLLARIYWYMVCLLWWLV